MKTSIKIMIFAVIVAILLPAFFFLIRKNDIESVLSDHDVNYRQVLHADNLGNIKLVFYEDMVTPQIGIAFLEKNLFSWKFISKAGFVQKKTVDFPWSFSFQSIKRNHFQIYYGYFTDKSIESVSVSTFNTSYEQKSKLVSVDSGFGFLWFCIINQPEEHWDINQIRIIFHRHNGDSFVINQ